MSSVLRNPRNGEYYVAVIKVDGGYRVFGRMVTRDGKLRTVGREFLCQSLSEAKQRCRSLVKTKRRRRGYEEVSPIDMPDMLAPFIEVPPEMQVTAEELLALAKEAQRERYVMMKDATGLEDSFDEGVEYIAITTDDPEFLNVFDRYGKPVGCHVSRLSNIQMTEKSEQVADIL